MIPLISVIVPVYNLEDYIAQCIESITFQTFEEWGLILVDDGSKDSSYKICLEYAKTDNRIKVITQPNGGVSKARQTGLKNSLSKYVIFVDGDDRLAPDALSYMYEIAEREFTDVVITAFSTNGKLRTYEDIGLFFNDKYFDMTLNVKIPMSTQNRLFKREVFGDYSNIIDRSIVNNEDYLWNILLAPNISRAYVDNYPTYYITCRPGSAGRTAYPASYWLHFFEYSKSLFYNAGYTFELYYHFFLKKFYSIIRQNKDVTFDFESDLFKEIKNYRASEALNIHEYIALFSIKHPSKALIFLLQLHPKKLFFKRK